MTRRREQRREDGAAILHSVEDDRVLATQSRHLKLELFLIYSSRELGNCNVDCDCTGVEWSSWSSCSSECPTCSRACGRGEKKQTRVCKISINAGRRCDDTDQVKMESCEHEKRCAKTIAGIWSQWGKWSDCSVNVEEASGRRPGNAPTLNWRE